MSRSATTTPASYKVRASNLVPDSANKIHDDDVAQRFGFSGALVPGVDLFAYVTHPLVEAWGTAFLTSGRVEVRFRRPVYDGDEIEVITEPDEAGGFRLRMIVGDDERAVGRAWPPGENNKVRRDYPTTPAPGRLLPTGPNPLPRRPLGDVEEPVSLERHDAYVQGIGETLPIYREEGVTHPGALLRIVNELLVRNVDLGPWIHTASSCHFLDLPTLPQTLRARGVVTECFERNNNAYVRYDALVLCDDRPVLEVDHTAIYRLG